MSNARGRLALVDEDALPFPDAAFDCLLVVHGLEVSEAQRPLLRELWRVLTSEGGAKSYDVAMYLVDHLYGEEVARGVGRGLIIDWPPAAGEMPARVVRD